MTTETATKWTAEAATNKAATYVAWIIADRIGNAEQRAMAYAEACAAAAAYQAVSEAHASDIEIVVKAAEAEYDTAWAMAIAGAGETFAAWEVVEAARLARDAHYAAYASYADAELGIAQAAADAILLRLPQKRAM